MKRIVINEIIIQAIDFILYIFEFTFENKIQMKVLFVGGSGIISSAVSRLAVERGIELYHFNRGKSHRKIEGVKNIFGDIRNVQQTKEQLKRLTF